MAAKMIDTKIVCRNVKKSYLRFSKYPKKKKSSTKIAKTKEMINGFFAIFRPVSCFFSLKKIITHMILANPVPIMARPGGTVLNKLIFAKAGGNPTKNHNPMSTIYANRPIKSGFIFLFFQKSKTTNSNRIGKKRRKLLASHTFIMPGGKYFSVNNIP